MLFYEAFSTYSAEFFAACLIAFFGALVVSPTLAVVGCWLQWAWDGRFSPSLPLLRGAAGRHVVVTGGSRGLGKAVARRLAAAGAHVTLVARGQRDLDAAVADLTAELAQQAGAVVPGGTVRAYAADVADADAMQALYAAHGLPDWLVLCAGASRPGYWATRAHRDEARAQIRLNYDTATQPLRALVAAVQMRASDGDPAAVAQRRGDDLAQVPAAAGLTRAERQLLPERIVFVGSMASFVALTGYATYCGSKYALRGFANALRSEWSPFARTHIHFYLPSNMDTPGYADENATKPAITHALDGSGGRMTPEAAADRMLALMASGRYYLANTIEGELIRIAMTDVIPRPSPFMECLAAPVLSFALTQFEWDARRLIRKYYRHAHAAQLNTNDAPSIAGVGDDAHAGPEADAGPAPQ